MQLNNLYKAVALKRTSCLWSFKTLLIMRLTTILLLFTFLQVSATTYAQKVSISGNDMPLKEVLKKIRKQTGYNFIYSDRLIRQDGTVTLQIKNSDLRDVLNTVFIDSELDYDIDNKVIIIKERESSDLLASVQTKELPDRKITGKVLDTKNNPLVGVTISSEDNGEMGTVSNQIGTYSIDIDDNIKSLTFSFIGYKTVKKKIPEGSNTLVVVMEPISKDLDELVVVGYGTQQRKDIVGAVESVDPGDITSTSSNLSTGFAGKIAGLVSMQRSGEPGHDEAQFYIRGRETFGSNPNPLLILDGIEITSAMLNNIAPESIESFSVLKDATATALYGSRGANGVIIIETKKGVLGERMKITATVESTISMPTTVQDIASGVDYMRAYNEAVINNNPSAGQFYSDEKIEGTIEGLNPYIFPENDWYHTLFKGQAFSQNARFNMSGGTNKIDYFLNIAFFNETGIIKQPKESDFDLNISNQKYLFQSNVGTDLTPTTRVELKMNSQLWYNTTPIESVSNLFYYSMRANPVRFAPTLPNNGDEFVHYGNNNSWDVGAHDLNPYALLSRGFSKRYQSWLTSVLTVDQDLSGVTEGLHAKVLASFYNHTESSNSRSIVPYYYRVDENYFVGESGGYEFTTAPIGDPGSTFLSYGTGASGYHEYNLQGQLNYDKSIGQHDVHVMGMFRIRERDNNTPGAAENDVLPTREEGIAGRISYNYDDRYMMEGNFGFNGSENFMHGKRFGFFPSIAVGYLLSNESFFSELRDKITYLKIRGSYGLAGDDILAQRFPYTSTVNMSAGISFWRGLNFVGASGPDITVLGNPDATWERSKKANLGLDLEFFDKINLTVDVFKDNRSGIFMQRQSLSASVGVGGNIPFANIGRVDNKGVDLQLGYREHLGKDWSIDVSGTFTYAHNTVVNMDEPPGILAYTSRVGHPIDAPFGLISDKLFADQHDIDHSASQEFGSYDIGDIKYKDLNDDSKIDGNDIKVIGNPTVPEIIYGLNLSVKYKKFDLTTFFQGAAKVSLVMSDMHPFATAGGSFGYGITQYIVDDHWSEENENIDAKYPRLNSQWSTNNTRTSDYWVRDGSYLRLKNAEIGYEPSRQFRVYVRGSNLATFSSFKLWDPEMGGGNGLHYPLQRTITVGGQFKF